MNCTVAKKTYAYYLIFYAYHNFNWLKRLNCWLNKCRNNNVLTVFIIYIYIPNVEEKNKI